MRKPEGLWFGADDARCFAMLHRPDAGSIRVLGQDVLAMDDDDLGDPVKARRECDRARICASASA